MRKDIFQLARARARASSNANNNANSHQQNNSISSGYGIANNLNYGRTIAIRFCNGGECAEWQGNRQLERQGAGYDIRDGEANLRNKLIAVTRAAKAMSSERVVILKNAPIGMGERYTFYGVEVFPKINAVMDGQSTMVSWINIETMSNEDVADLIIAVINNQEIMGA